MTEPAVRSPGHYAVLDGAQHRVSASGPDYVMVVGPYGPVRHPMDDVEDLLSVSVMATWRGGRVAVNAVAGDKAGFYTSDGRLADRESLGGDFYNGWHGEALISDLEDVTERATSIHPRTR